MKYRKQRHRYYYFKDGGRGHIGFEGAPETFCGLETQRVKVRLTYAPDIELCEQCTQKLKQLLAEEYGIEHWA